MNQTVLAKAQIGADYVRVRRDTGGIRYAWAELSRMR
jgi:hypothetical protein